MISSALGCNVSMDVVTGSNVKPTDSVNIIACPSHDPRSMKSRLICWIKHYFFIKKWIKNNKKNHYDLIFATSNPPINSYIGLKLKKAFNCPFIYMNWDLYPHVIEEAIKNPIAKFICGLWHKWNNKNYCKIDQMITIADVVAESINAKLTDKIDIDIIPIDENIDTLKPVIKGNNKFAVENKLDDKFVILYSGKMGYGHNIEVILEAAKKLSDYPDIKFVFIGKGPKRKLIEEHISNKVSDNVILFDYQPAEVFPYSMACGDIGIVSQEESMAHLFMPSKTYSMMSCGEAIIGICSNRDDLRNVIESNNIGYAVSGENVAEKIADSILELYNNPDKLLQFKSNSRKTIENNYSTTIVTKKYSELFEKVMK